MPRFDPNNPPQGPCSPEPSPPSPDPAPGDFSRKIVAWFNAHGRHLPWRPDEDPYRIWLMVVMLQQTRVETVLPYYHRFVAAFPSLEDLAMADEEHVLELWKGMGYYRRARNLLAGAREMASTYRGRVPSDPAELMRLPGVGRYTAAAVTSIAFDAPVPAVDGNVQRFLSRLFAETGDITRPDTQKRLEEHARILLPPAERGIHNQAVMDFGALVCAPVPRCADCPVAEVCLARSRGIERELPTRPARRGTAIQEFVVARILDQEGRTLLHRRPDDGLLAGFWEFPNVPATKGDIRAAFQETLGLCIEPGEALGKVSHAFTHRRWLLDVRAATLASAPPDTKDWHWSQTPREETLPRAFSRILSLFEGPDS